jgi:hypothetical protein
MRAGLVVVSLVGLLAGPAVASGTDAFGPAHWLMPGTRLTVDVEPGESFAVEARSRDGGPFEVEVILPDGTREAYTLAPGEPGWGEGSAELRFAAAPGRSQVAFRDPGRAEPLRLKVNVVVEDTDGQAQPGRLSSLRWEIDSGSYLELTNTEFFVPVPVASGHVLWRLELDGVAGYEFQISASAAGLAAPLAGRSAPAPATPLSADYDVFLEPPPRALVDAAPPEVELYAADETGVVFFASEGGVAQLVVDLDGDGVAGATPAESPVVSSVRAGGTSLPWDGRDGDGRVIPPGTYEGELRVRTGEFHFVAFDVEFARPGVRIHRVTSSGVEAADMRWDDTLVDDGTLSLVVTGPAGLSSGDPSGPLPASTAHGWGTTLGDSGGPGDLSFIDTWVLGDEVITPLTVTIPPADAGASDAGAPSDDAGANEDAGLTHLDGGLAPDAAAVGPSPGDAGFVDAGEDPMWVADAGVDGIDGPADAGASVVAGADAGPQDGGATGVPIDASDPALWPLTDGGVEELTPPDLGAGPLDDDGWARPAGAPAPQARAAGLPPGVAAERLYGGWGCSSVAARGGPAVDHFVIFVLMGLLRWRARPRPSAA